VSRWADVVAAEPEFAERALQVLMGRKHRALATLRRDGSPRLTGIEVELVDGDLVLGMMPGSRKLADVERDPRVAILALSDDPLTEQPQDWGGDVQLSGRALPLDRPEGPPHFRLDLDRVVLTTLGGADHLLIESWSPGRPLKSIKRL
jgi:hypothetical protein